MINKKILPLLLFFAAGCYRVPDKINPKIDYEVQDQHIAYLKDPFDPLSSADRLSDWGREMIIARAFADELDLYRAISTYKRAEILATDRGRKLEIQYDILLCYFLAKHYDEAVEYFEKSGLAHVDKAFPAYRDLLLILYESYREMDNPEKEERILELMEKTYPETAEKIRISRAVREGNLSTIQKFSCGPPPRPYICRLLNNYKMEKKSIATAQALNAFVPGAGYLYIGQRSSAFTAFFLNSLFIVAAYEFFHHGHTAGGIITTIFEAGWYFGGIYGVGLETKYYNERIYEKNAASLLNENKLFPVLMLQYGF